MKGGLNVLVYITLPERSDHFVITWSVSEERQEKRQI